MLSPYSDEPTGNLLLDALTPRQRSRLPLTMVQLVVGQVLYEAHEQVRWSYFPTSCVVSCLYTTRDGTTAETALIANEGMLSVASFLAEGTSSTRAVVQVAGSAWRCSPRSLQSEFAQAGAVQCVLLQYMNALITQISQTAICNRLHPLEQRLCRWLLLCRDGVGRDEFLLTQELIANALGGRRESVTVVAGHLQALGAIGHSRGRIRIVDRRLLEELACECYGVVKSRRTKLRADAAHNPVAFTKRVVVGDRASSLLS